MRNVSYLFNSLMKTLLGRGLTCPSCSSKGGFVVDRKYIVTSLRRCANCKLLNRTPTTSAGENKRLYQRDYREGFTTTMPSDSELKDLLDSSFRNGEKEYSCYIDLLRALDIGSGARILDFGCSWGYGSWQLAKAGFCVDAYDISKPRADYAASKLGVHIIDVGTIENSAYDVFFSAHVIEHVPSVSGFIQLGMKALRPGGIFIASTPNASSEYRRLKPEGFHLSWGFVHPQLIDWEFLQNLQPCTGLIADSSPYCFAQLQGFAWDKKAFIKLDGDELMFAIKNFS